MPTVCTTKETTEFCKKLQEKKIPFWEDLAQQLGKPYNVIDLKKIMNKYSRDPLKCTHAETFFCTEVEKVIAETKLYYVEKLGQDPQTLRSFLSLMDPKFSEKYTDARRIQAIVFAKSLKKICLDPNNKDLTPEDIYEMVSNDIMSGDFSMDVIYANRILSEDEE